MHPVGLGCRRKRSSSCQRYYQRTHLLQAGMMLHVFKHMHAPAGHIPLHCPSACSRDESHPGITAGEHLAEVQLKRRFGRIGNRDNLHDARTACWVKCWWSQVTSEPQLWRLCGTRHSGGGLTFLKYSKRSAPPGVASVRYDTWVPAGQAEVGQLTNGCDIARCCQWPAPVHCVVLAAARLAGARTGNPGDDRGKQHAEHDRGLDVEVHKDDDQHASPHAQPHSQRPATEQEAR